MRYLILLVLAIPEAGASEILTNIDNAYYSASSGWRDVIFPHAQRLFFVLASLQLVWSTVRWVLAGDGVERLMTHLLFLLMSLSLFYAILTNAHVWIPALLESFMGIGAEAAGVEVLDPSSVVDLGISIAMAVPRELSVMGVLSDPGSGLLAITVSLVTAASFAVIAGQLLITLIESYIVISGGVLMLGFAGSRWTVPFAEKFLGYAVAVGVKLFMLYLIVGIGVTMAATWGPMIETAGLSNLAPYYEVLISSLIFASLAWSIPATAGSLVSGAVNMTLGSVTGTALMTGAGIAGGGAAAVGALGTSVKTLNRSMQNLTAAVKHGNAVGSGEHSLAKGVGAGVGSLASEAGRMAMYRMGGGHNRVASNITRRTSAYRARTDPPRSRHGGAIRPKPKSGGGIREAAHNVPKDEANVQTNDVHLRVDDDDR